MRGAPSRHVGPASRGRAVFVAIAATVFFALVLVAGGPSAHAQNASVLAGPPVGAGEKMLVESDQIVYDYDNNVVSAVGNVRIYYAGYMLEAEKVSYDERTGRLLATGSVKLVDPTGAVIYSQYIDITDDFRDGFVESLRVDTAQRTYFTADRAERSGGDTTTFFRGSYTACEACRDHPDRPVLWNVKAAKIVVDNKEQMVYFTDAKLEFFGMPIAWLPYFAMPDPAVKRKTGWLAPGFGYEARVGFFLSTPYYWAPAPNYDITFTPVAYSRQGLLTDIEWRHNLENGSYMIRGAGIYQLDPNAFPAGSPGRTSVRAAIRTAGEFYINQDWTLGWDGTLSSDRSFTRNYGVLNGDTSETTSTVRLTGLGERNFFEARASYYEILTEETAGAQYAQSRQGVIAPVVDYNKISNTEIFGGELSFTTNFADVIRGSDDPFMVAGDPATYYHGTAGTVARATQEVAWQKRIVGPMGQVITPFASLRGDAFFLNQATAAPVVGGATATRLMPAVGVEWSWPILATLGGSTHIIEPVAQVIARPNEIGAGTLPNNDAQSLVFDTSTLFDRDKFSGFDRVEGGTRANIGVRYNGTFGSGASIEGTFGQSIQLAGVNPFAADPIANVGAFSGLETTFSDYVAGVSINTGLGPRFTARGRFDEKNFDVNRAEVQATTAVGPVTASANYLFLRSDPNSGMLSPASVVRAAASYNFAENWRAFGTVTFDLAKSALAGDSFGIAFDNECLTLSLAYSEIRQGYTDQNSSRWLNFRIAFRTLGETTYASNLSKLTN